MGIRKKQFIIVGILILAGVVGVGLASSRQTDSREDADKIFASLEQRSSSPEIMRLQKGLKPPTNRWFSSLVFGETRTVFAYPLSFRAHDDGFELSVPKVSSQAAVVTAPHAPDVRVRMEADSYAVSRYDDMSVTLRYRAGERDVAEITFAQGSPYVFVYAREQTVVRVEFEGTSGIRRADAFTRLFQSNDQRYGLRADDIDEASENSFNLLLPKDGHASVFAIPQNATQTSAYTEAAKYPLLGTGTEHSRSNTKLDATLWYDVKGSRKTLFGSLPHHEATAGGDGLGSFQTLYGTLTMHQGRELTYQLDAFEPAERLDISGISNKQKDSLRQLLAKDTESLTLAKTDTYFGGKELYRAANLLQLADQLGEEGIRRNVQTALHDALATWFGPPDGRTNRFFYYDRTLQGVVGVEPAFGSETFNDHHFHYGYFIYAASVLARYDESFVQEYGEAVNALAADIANTDKDCAAPELRVIDRFTGHSWASGFSDFHDGNNQESSSEAINAWYALYLWAHVTGNDELEKTALWLYGSETTTARRYWLNDQRDQPGFGNYEHPFVSLVWNGKRDYATFFSSRPQAMLGIQLIPMSPGHMYLQDTGIAKNLQSAPATGQFADYLIMYEALADPERALVRAENLQDSEIDDANSRTYLYAWLYSRAVQEA